ncbi:MAG: alcohol dehydrogenase catalytic domain-containing protein [Planctomycetota bacterium]|jgi:threonine dehydrogenase-like Zn-dependent dehydrogenase
MDKYKLYSSNADSTIPETMQALVASGSGFENLMVKQVSVPKIGPDQLLARVDAAGVCTSILKLIEQGEKHPFINGWDMKQWPVILGDEGAVTLVKIGENLKDKYQAGQRYAIQPAVDVQPILHRQRYNNNTENMHKCAVGYTLGGHLAQYICIQQEVLAGQCLLPLPDNNMPYFTVSMAEPISCIYSAQQRNYHIIKDSPGTERKPQLGLLPGGVTVVIGAGAMGRMHAELALRFSPKVLIVSDLQQERLDKVVKNIGQKANSKNCKLVCVLPDKLETAVTEQSNNRGADDIILAVGIQSVQQNALRLLAAGGVANLFGGLPRGKHILELDALAVHYQEVKLVGSSGGEPSDMVATLKTIADKEIDPGNYVAAVGSLDKVIDVLKMIKETKIDGKAILYPHIEQTPLQPVDYWDNQKEIEFLNSHLI